jgi:hypothetical protein
MRWKAETKLCNTEVVAKLHLIGLAAEESKDTGQWANVKELLGLNPVTRAGYSIM